MALDFHCIQHSISIIYVVSGMLKSIRSVGFIISFKFLEHIRSLLSLLEPENFRASRIICLSRGYT